MDTALVQICKISATPAICGKKLQGKRKSIKYQVHVGISALRPTVSVDLLFKFSKNVEGSWTQVEKVLKGAKVMQLKLRIHPNK